MEELSSVILCDMGIGTINPSLYPAPKPERGRKSMALEFLSDEGLSKAITTGTAAYKNVFTEGMEATAEEGVVESSKASFENLALLNKIFESEAGKSILGDLPRQHESVRTGWRGEKTAKIILGSRAVQDQAPVKQIEISGILHNNNSEEERRTTLSYQGQSPEHIILSDKPTKDAIRLGICIKNVGYIPEDNRVKQTDSTGIAIDINQRTGQIDNVQGFTYKLGRWHYAELPEIDQEALSEMQVSAETIDTIKSFIEQ